MAVALWLQLEQFHRKKSISSIKIMEGYSFITRDKKQQQLISGILDIAYLSKLKVES